ncbi:cysteine dioxygenase type 1-like [Achroia grisella]|uniref:cysteine dioxygenase type 1-like n=1 Tax=Achroia grisella TaxID=688607 RepID=UPI0027D2FB65|nr:cysteine dioxygenase type 1-like [Achroia grisella]
MDNLDIESVNCKIRLSEYTDTGKLCAQRPVDIKEEIPDLETLIDELYKIFSYDHVNVDDVQALMSRYKSDRKHWKKYAKFDRLRYTRNLVDAGNGAFNIMILCWGPGHASPIHDHADSHCFMKLLSGSLEEVRYQWPQNVHSEVKKSLKNKQSGCQRQINDTCCQSDSCQCAEMADICERTVRIGAKCEQDGDQECNISDMVEIGKTSLKLDDVCYINDAQGLHRMQNGHVDEAVSLHLYCPPFDSCQVFDARSGKPTIVPVTFWSKYGTKVDRNIAAKTQIADSQ